MRLEVQQEVLHRGEDAHVVGDGRQDDVAAAEGLADQLTDMGLRHVIDRHIRDSVLGDLRRKRVGRALCSAVNRAVDHHNRFFFRGVAAPQAVLFDDPAQVLSPNRTVCGTQDLDIHRTGFCQDVLDLLAVLADDVAVIAAGIREPVLLEVHLVGKEIAVERTEAAERIRREQRSGNRVIGHHNFGPVDHRCRDEGQCMLADVQGVALAHQDAAVRDVAGEELVQDQGGRQGADHLGIRIAYQHLGDGGAVVRLHVVHDEIVQISPVQHRGQILKKLTCYRAVHRIDQNRLLIQNHIGVVCHAAGNGIYVLEQLDAPVAHADVDDVVRHHAAASDPAELLLAFKRQAGLLLFLRKSRHAAQRAGGHKAGRACSRCFQEVSSRDFFAHLFAPLVYIFAFLPVLQDN